MSVTGDREREQAVLKDRDDLINVLALSSYSRKFENRRLGDEMREVSERPADKYCEVAADYSYPPFKSIQTQKSFREKSAGD